MMPTRALPRRVLLLLLLLLGGCSAESAKKGVLWLLDALDRALPVPAPQSDRKVADKRPVDPRPVRPPLLQIEHGSVHYQGHRLPLPGSVAEWEKALGHYAMPYGGAPNLRAEPNRTSCDVLWDALGIAASGRWRAHGSEAPVCELTTLEILLDADERSLMHPSSDIVRKGRPQHDFPGTLVVEGVRLEKGMKWSEVYDGWHKNGVECPWTTSTMTGPRIDMRCERASEKNYVYHGLLVRPIPGQARLLLGLARRGRAPASPFRARCASIWFERSVPLLPQVLVSRHRSFDRFGEDAHTLYKVPRLARSDVIAGVITLLRRNRAWRAPSGPWGGEIVGTSEMYTSSGARETGIASVKVNAPLAGASS